MGEQISFLTNYSLDQAVMNLQNLHQSGSVGQWFFDLPRTDVKITSSVGSSVEFHLARRIRYGWGIAAIHGQLISFHQGATQVEAECPLLTPYLWFSLLGTLLILPFFVFTAGQIELGLFMFIVMGLGIGFWIIRISMARNYLMQLLREALQ